MFSLRIVNVDHYMSSPKSGLDLTYSQFRGAQVKSVPVFRIFGSTPSGNKTCLHVHGVFPYILVPFSGEDDAGKLMYQLASSLDKAINVSQNSSHSTRQHVFKIVQVSGRPFYGYHSQDHQFFKIFFYNPLIVKRACDLLQNGAVCGTKFQIHEGHVPFSLQFFIDYNLYGMSYINLKSVVYRKDASPPGVASGSLPKESGCELEADAVAVDILNRLTIEGELAVNPGLAAIWQEEKKRLKRDALEISQRPEPPLAMSEKLLREKLKDNLKFKGKCKTPLKENIPYPVETQRTTGSDVLDASVLDTHSISSLTSARSRAPEETTIIDEEMVLSLTQSSGLSSSLDHSLLVALDNLAAQNEVNAVISQNVEDDSILGSQMFPDQDLIENDIRDGELEALNFNLPLDLPSDNHSEDESDEVSDDNFDENIPQLDGVGDFGGKKKKAKQSKRKRKVLVENSATEIDPLSDGEEILLNNIKDSNCWPDSGKQETLEEIFSDEEPYNSPINNFDDSCEPVDLEPINVDLIGSFETVLRGDPSFTCGDMASEDVMFQAVVENVEDIGETKALIEGQGFKEAQNICDKKYFVDKNSNTDAVPSLNNSLDSTDMDKSVMLAISGEELLNTSQLDEILNEDLNKGLEIICEKSPQQEFEENWDKSRDSSIPSNVNKEDEDCVNEESLTTNNEFLCNSDERTTDEIIANILKESEENLFSEELLGELKLQVEVLDTTFCINDASFNEIQQKNNGMSSLLEDYEKKSNNTPDKKSNKTPKKKVVKKTSSNALAKKGEKHTFGNGIKWLRKNFESSIINKHYQPFEMSINEIKTYYSQLETVTQHLSMRTDVEQPLPILWTPIRENMKVERKNKRKRKWKPKNIREKIIKKCKFSKKEILKMKMCKVKLYKLTENDIKLFSRNTMGQLSNWSKNKPKIEQDNKFEQKGLKSKLSNLNISLKPQESLYSTTIKLESEIPAKERNLTQKKSPKCKSNGAKKVRCLKSSPLKVSDKLSHIQKEEKVMSIKETKEIMRTECNTKPGNQEASFLPNQSSSFKLNKKCVLRLTPLSEDKPITTTIKDSPVTKGVKRKGFSVNTFNKPMKGSQEHMVDVVSASEKLNEERNINPSVMVNRLVISLNYVDDIVPFRNEISVFQSNKIPLNKEELKSEINNSLKHSANRKRPLRIYSLDGTVDNCSSDENLDEKGSNNKLSDTCSTPIKRRKSKSCHSPRNYAPLNIEIKKSPSVKPKDGTEEIIKPLVVERLRPEHIIEGSAKDVLQDSSSSEKHDSSKCHEKSKHLEPLVLIKRLPSVNTSTSDLADVNQSTTSTSSHPLVKRLKVFVKRLSLDAQGDLLEHERVVKLKGMSHRRSSLPITSQEKISSAKKIDRNRKCHSKGGLDALSNSSTANIRFTDKSKKARKALQFPEQGEEISRNECGTHKSTEIVKKKSMPDRKFSTDMFEANSTPESTPLTFNHSGDSSSSFLRLSGVSKNDFSDYDDDTLISESPQNNTILSLNLSECDSENISILKINRNPHELKNPTHFTPATGPPSRSEVLVKLREFGLPEVVNEEPFYSEPGDVSKACEVGSTVLKVKSKSTTHLEEFEGTFSCFTKWKKEYTRSIHSKEFNFQGKNTVANKILIITPLKPPPTQLQVKEWLKSKLVKKVKEVVESKKVTKIVLPSSPGDQTDDKDDDSMTVSQCSLPSMTSDGEVVQSLNTPEMISNKTNVSPLMASTPVCDQLKMSYSKRRFSRPSSGFRQSLPLIEEQNQVNLQDGVSLVQVDQGGESLNQDAMSFHQNCLNPHEDDMSLQQDGRYSQTASTSTKLFSNSGIKRLLSESKSPASTSCQIDMATPRNSGNYRLELENLQDVRLIQEHQFLTILSMELHVHTRGDLRPNPDHDAICCIFYNITNDYPDPSLSNISGAIFVSSDQKEEKMPQFQCEFKTVADEASLIAAFLALVRKWDPDIFVGYEIELLSWGYLLQRAYVLNMNLVAELSRVNRASEGELREVSDDDSEIRLTGRIVLNLWRFLRHEVALQSYTFENIMYHVLHQRIPLFSFRTLTSWWAHRTKLYRWMVFEHYLTRVEGVAKLMRQVDLVGRTSEFARLFGIQFYEVLSRGSQFRVESMMLRLVKPLNYVAVSPSVQQRAKMRAPESLPLIMEPQSRFYTDPVIVLDFQSLYPSIIIAYNYCFSTCLGRVEHLGRSELFEFGCTQLKVPVVELLRLKDSLNFSPCGIAFVNQSIVRGVLPRMLEEILNTRLMVKQSMKENKDNKTLQRVLHNRQLGLKLIANVTYGYTAANFSGRMPCIEVGDSVVSKARETLERAISLVSNNKQWGARVIYGDTDSMFVLVPGKSREEAFRIGAEIAEAVTNDNPQPVKLKLEKVYQPCLLQTKKRYVGYMYESPSQKEPVYDAKGIETVRRDGCPAVAKVLEKSLKLLFESKDVSLVKRFVCRQFSKVLSGRVSIQDLTFAREYRGAAGYRPGACVPALELTKQGRAVDPRSEPRVGERVPYVVIAGAPGLPLIRLVRPPSALLHDPGLRINAEYYVTRVIAPPLDRCLSLLGAQVSTWFTELPRKQQLYLPNVEALYSGARKATISQYFATCGCIGCGRMTSRGVCDHCQLQPQQLGVTLASQVLNWERRVSLVTKICQSCCGRTYETDCTSLDCPVLYRLCQARKDLRQVDYVRGLQQEFISF